MNTAATPELVHALDENLPHPQRKPKFQYAPRTYGWRAHLGQFIRAHVHLKQAGDGRRTGLGTRHNIATGLFRLFDVLKSELKFGLEKPDNLDTRHVRALFDWMEKQWEAGALQSSTIQGYVSYLRILSRWIGKPELLETVHFRNPECGRRRQMAQTDKSWEGNSIDVAAAIEKAWDIEPWAAMALLAQAAFGLRRKEAVCLIPEKDYVPEIGMLCIVRGTKGGRTREIRNLTEWQYEVLAMLIEFCWRGAKRKSHIGGTAADLQSNLRRYSYVLGSKLGITKDLVGTTGHGLRAGFACRILEAHGITAPVRGGDVSTVDPELRSLAYKAASEALGHSREAIVGAYVGSRRDRGDTPHPDGQDDSRIDPPNMGELIATLRKRRAQHLAGVRKMQRRANQDGLEPVRYII